MLLSGWFVQKVNETEKPALWIPERSWVHRLASTPGDASPAHVLAPPPAPVLPARPPVALPPPPALPVTPPAFEPDAPALIVIEPAPAEPPPPASGGARSAW